ncbi:DgyrCDS7738 [Dimorphilus gyrociliatus]|nr:DgyrCDS7738 [Dimorphilus gyrociliatus]
MPSVWQNLKRVRKRASKWRVTLSFDLIEVKTTSHWQPSEVRVKCKSGRQKHETAWASWQPQVTDPYFGVAEWTTPCNIEARVTLFRLANSTIFDAKLWKVTVLGREKNGKHKEMGQAYLDLSKHVDPTQSVQQKIKITMEAKKLHCQSAGIQLTISTALITEALATDDDLRSLASSDCSRINDVANMEDVEEEVTLPTSNGIRNEDVLEIFSNIESLKESHSPSPVPSPTPLKVAPPNNLFLPKKGEETPFDYSIDLEELRKRLALSPETNLNNTFEEEKNDMSVNDELEEMSREVDAFCINNFENPSSPVENTLSARYATRNSRDNSPEKLSEEQKLKTNSSIFSEREQEGEDIFKGYSIYEKESAKKNFITSQTLEIRSEDRYDVRIEEEIIEEEEEEEQEEEKEIEGIKENIEVRKDDKILSNSEIREKISDNINKLNDSSNIQNETNPFVNGNSDYTRESQNSTPSFSNGVAAVENSRCEQEEEILAWSSFICKKFGVTINDLNFSSWRDGRALTIITRHYIPHAAPYLTAPVSLNRVIEALFKIENISKPSKINDSESLIAYLATVKKSLEKKSYMSFERQQELQTKARELIEQYKKPSVELKSPSQEMSLEDERRQLEQEQVRMDKKLEEILEKIREAQKEGEDDSDLRSAQVQFVNAKNALHRRIEFLDLQEKAKELTERQNSINTKLRNLNSFPGKHSSK